MKSPEKHTHTSFAGLFQLKEKQKVSRKFPKIEAGFGTPGNRSDGLCSYAMLLRQAKLSYQNSQAIESESRHGRRKQSS